MRRHKSDDNIAAHVAHRMGHHPNYIFVAREAMWLMLQQTEPEDFVIATGRTQTVRAFVDLAFREAGIELEWLGQGCEERGVDRQSGEVLVEVDPRYFRPTEVDLLLGDATKARQKLGSNAKTTLAELCSMMVQADIRQAQRDLLCEKNGFRVRKESE